MNEFSEPRLLIRHPRHGLIRITGTDRLLWLQGIITADMFNVPDGAFWALFLDRTGKIRHEVIGAIESNSIVLFALSESVAALHRYLDSMAVMEDVALQVEPQCSLWSVHGLGSDVDVAEEGDIGIVASGRLSWAAPRDTVVAVSASDEYVWLSAMQRLGLVPASSDAWESLRIEACLPKWGVDYSGQDTPHHAGLFGRAVAPNKGCYVGQEVVCKVEMRGRVAQRVARLALSSAQGIRVGMPVIEKSTGDSAGTITSIAPDTGHHPAYALARVKFALIEQSAEITVGHASGCLSVPDGFVATKLPQEN